MRVLLINPNNSHIVKSNFPNEIEEKMGAFLPLGLLYIAAFLKKRSRHIVSVLDMHAQNISLFSLKEIIKEVKPDITGLYNTTFNLIDAYLVAQAIKEVNPAIYVTLGGPHVNIYPHETIANKNIDFIVLGEGEIAFSELADVLEQGADLSAVKGIFYKDKGKIIKTDSREPINNLDDLPFPDRTMLDFKDYHNVLTQGFPSTTMISSRGCSYACRFCYHSHLGKHIRFRSSANVVSEMESCLALGIKDIFFHDDTFTFNEQRTFNICDEIIKRGLDISWSIKTRVDTVNKEMLVKLKKAGCGRIQFGIESGNNRVLALLNKGISINQIKEAFRLSKQAGVETMAYFMVGSPSETAQDISDTIDFARQLNPDYAHFSITMPLPGTDLYKTGLEDKVLKSDFWKEFAVNPSTEFTLSYWEEYFTEKELARLLKYAYRRFYFRFSYLLRMLFKINSWRELKNKIRIFTRLTEFTFK